ncbi:MAG: DUF927 domain-containing protein, partial [Bacteroides sp.]|nr:DUF927 domain-containing protein [Bacteroides sp.]
SQLCSYLYHSYEDCTNVRYCTSLSGWFTVDGLKRFSLFDDSIEILANEGTAEAFAAFRTRGTLEGWKQNVLSNVVKCYGASFIFAAGLAAPLFSLFDFNSIPVTMTASSGDGKSVSAHAALSAWCHPKEIEMSGSSSIAGIKSILTVLRDVPTLIDEVQLKANEKLSDLIYDVGNSGKAQKANRDGSARKVARIRTTAFFTGERSMSDCVLYEGANVRMIQMREIDMLAELRNDERLIDILRLGSFEHFGHFAPLYISRLTGLYNSGNLEIRVREFEATLASEDRTQSRQRERYAAMLTGCSVLGEILGEEFSRPLMDAVHKHWNEAVNDREPQSIANRSLETLTDFVISNGHLFGESMSEDITTTPWGEWQDDGQFAILNESLKQVLRDFDLTEVKRHWKRNGWLNIAVSALERKRFTNTARIGSRAKATCLLLTRDAVEGMLPEHLKQPVELKEVTV